MCVNCDFELSLLLDGDKFEELFSKCYCGDGYLEADNSGYLDHTLSEKGLKIRYRDSQYKKKVVLTVNAIKLTDGAPADSEKLIKKLEKLIEKYFKSEYTLEDFKLCRFCLSTTINIGDRKSVAAYLKVIKRIGRVKGFSTVAFDLFEKDAGFYLQGNSNGVEFLIYDLEQIAKKQLLDFEEKANISGSDVYKCKGIIQTEVHLTKQKAIRKYTAAYSTEDQIIELSKRSKTIFMETFARIIPYGDFYKKDEAISILRQEVNDEVTKRKMLRLISLIPKKKSLHLAQKEMAYRHPDDLLVEFAKINLSPVTISKRQDVKCLKNLYEYL